MLNSKSIVIIRIKGEHLLYSKISGGMIGYGWGNVCYIVNFTPGEYLLYTKCILGEGLIYSKYSEGECLLHSKHSGERFAIRHRHSAIRTEYLKLIVYSILHDQILPENSEIKEN